MYCFRRYIHFCLFPVIWHCLLTMGGAVEYHFMQYHLPRELFFVGSRFHPRRLNAGNYPPLYMEWYRYNEGTLDKIAHCHHSLHFSCAPTDDIRLALGTAIAWQQRV